MSSDYLPGKDLELQTWMNKFMLYLGANLAHFGLVAADIADMQLSETDFSMARFNTEAALTTYRGLVQDKNLKRETMESLIRPMVARLQTYPETTNQDREELGIPLRGVAPTVPVGIDTSVDRPIATVNISQRLKHTLRIQNQNEDVITAGKPAGVRAVEVWAKVGPAPVDETDVTYVDVSTRNTVTVPYAGADGNKQAHYQMRWVYSNGEKGNWSEVVSATIAA